MCLAPARIGSTFTWYGLGEIWLCAACFASIGGLVQICNHCGQPPAPGTQLIHVFRAGRLCFSCRRDRLRFARPNS